LWCHNIYLTGKQRKTIEQKMIKSSEKGLAVALLVNKKKREDYLKSVFDRNKHLSAMLKNKDVAKIILAVLYLGEGAKNRGGSLVLGNSDPNIINLFLKLLRFCYKVDETKLRCTLQCRADQKIKSLENFWSKITDIPPARFYKAQIDPRTIGKASKKLDYKGVCRIDYFSADIFTDLMEIGKILYNNI